MTDVHSPETRSKNMRAIRSANTKPELIVRKSLHAAGFRYRLGGAGLPGRPDLVLPKYRTVIFVHGCFWHGHECKFSKIPQTRTEFWTQKIQTNKERDARSTLKLLELGWTVVVIWECFTRSARNEPTNISNSIRKIVESTGIHPVLSFVE